MNLELPEGVCDSHVHAGNYFPKIHTSFTPAALEKHLDKYNIESVLVSSGIEKMRDYTHLLLKQDNKRLFILIRGFTPNELEHVLENNGQVVGLKVNPSQEKRRVIDKHFKPYLEILNRHNAILLLHCGRWQEMSSWIFGLHVNNDYPEIKLILAHMGGTHVDLAIPCIEAIRYKRNIFLDTSQARQPIIFKYAIKRLGSKRILFGSDIPWGNYLSNLVMLLDLDLKESELNNILRENFINLVGVEKVVPLP